MKAPVEVLGRKKTCKKYQYLKVVSPTHLPDSECRMGPSVGGVGASLGSLTVIIENFWESSLTNSSPAKKSNKGQSYSKNNFFWKIPLGFS